GFCIPTEWRKKLEAAYPDDVGERKWGRPLTALTASGELISSYECLHSSEYLSTLGAAIGKAIEKEMQDGLAAGITHGVDGYWGTSDTVHAPITTALSITLTFANTVAPITVDDYGVMGTNDWAGVDADPFPNMDDVDLNMP
nr:hypothetical protein [Tanacetum cinerariifolium]